MPSGVKKKSARRKQKDKKRKANNRKILAGGHHAAPTNRKKVTYQPPPPVEEEEDDSSSSSSSSSEESSSSESLPRPIVPKQVIPVSSLSRKNSVTWSDLSGPESKRSLGTGTNSNTNSKGSSQGPQTSGFPRAREILKKPTYFGKRPSVVLEVDKPKDDDKSNNSSSDDSDGSSESGSEYTSSSSDSTKESQMKFTYPMWHRHHIMVETALHSHTEQAEIMKTGMKRLQKVHDQTETHPIIAKLLIAKFTYEGFEYDKRFAMDLYLKLEDKAAKEFIMDMVKKQKALKMKQELEQKKKKLDVKEEKHAQQKQHTQQPKQQESDEESSSSEEESGSEDESSSSEDSSNGEEKKMEEPIFKKTTPNPPSKPVSVQPVLQSYNNNGGVPSYITSGDDTSYSSVGASVGGSNPFKHMQTSTQQQQTIPKATKASNGIFDNIELDNMEWKTSKQKLSTKISQPNSELLKVDMDVSVSSESPRDVMRRIETQWTNKYRPSRRRSVDVVSKESARERMRRLEQKYHKNSSM